MAIRKDRFGNFGAGLSLDASVAAPVATSGVAPALPRTANLNFNLDPSAPPLKARLLAPTKLSSPLLRGIAAQMPGVGGGVALENQVPVQSIVLPATPDLNAAYMQARGIQVSTAVPPVKTAQEQLPPSSFTQPLAIEQQGPLPKQELPSDVSAMPKQQPVIVPDSSICPPGYAKDYSGQCRLVPPPPPTWKEVKLPTIQMNISTSHPLPEDMSAMPDAKPVNPNVAVAVSKPPSALPLVGTGAAGGFLVGGPVGAAVGAVVGFFLHKPPAATLAPEQSAVVRAQAATLDVSALTPEQQRQYEAEKAAFLAEGGAAGMQKTMESILDNAKPGVTPATLQGFGRLAAKRARRSGR